MPTFYVNKERVDVGSNVPGETPLLQILRDPSTDQPTGVGETGVPPIAPARR